MNIKSFIYKLRLVFQRRPMPLEKPTVIQFPVIDICNSRCQMCRIWENKKSTDISVDQLAAGLRSDLFSEVIAIGFNGGEPTLRPDLSALVRTVVDALPSLAHISLITNAFKYKQAIQQVDDMADISKSKGLNFDVMVSLDGF